MKIENVMLDISLHQTIITTKYLNYLNINLLFNFINSITKQLYHDIIHFS